MLRLSTYVKSAFGRGIIRQALFYLVCLLGIYVLLPAFNHLRGFHSPHGDPAVGWHLLLAGISLILVLVYLMVLIFEPSRGDLWGALLVVVLYMGGVVGYLLLRMH